MRAVWVDLGDRVLPGTVLAWRWEDEEHTRWRALVRMRDGILQYERWESHLALTPRDGVTPPP